MGIATSNRWQIALHLGDVSLKPANEDEALRLIQEAESGTLAATGDSGDYVDIQFDGEHALVLYMTAEKTILRPHFPNRKETGEGVEVFFCPCCGVQLGDRAELRSRCMGRGEGLRLFREILHGLLPNAVPESRLDQPRLPGLEGFAEDETRWRQVEWVPLRRHRKDAHE